jgi:hypothetical protein
MGGAVLIMIVYYIAHVFPFLAPYAPNIANAIVAALGVPAVAIAWEDGSKAHAAASVEIAKHMAQAPAEPAAAPDNTTTVNVAPATAGG